MGKEGTSKDFFIGVPRTKVSDTQYYDYDYDIIVHRQNLHIIITPTTTAVPRPLNNFSIALAYFILYISKRDLLSLT